MNEMSSEASPIGRSEVVLQIRILDIGAEVGQAMRLQSRSRKLRWQWVGKGRCRLEDVSLLVLEKISTADQTWPKAILAVCCK